MADVCKPYNMPANTSLPASSGRIPIVQADRENASSARSKLARPTQIVRISSIDVSQERAALERIYKAFSRRTDDN